MLLTGQAVNCPGPDHDVPIARRRREIAEDERVRSAIRHDVDGRVDAPQTARQRGPIGSQPDGVAPGVAPDGDRIVGRLQVERVVAVAQAKRQGLDR